MAREGGREGEGRLEICCGCYNQEVMVTWLHPQVGGMAVFMRVVKLELGIEKQAHVLRLAQYVRELCAGALSRTTDH